MGQESEPATIQNDFYSTVGLNPFEERTNDSFNETISPFNGILHLSYTDVFIPGNGGMDISVVRRYSTSVGGFNAIRHVYGYGWDISYGKLIHGAGSLNAETCSTGVQDLTDTKNNPKFETPDGSNEMLVFNDRSMSSASNAILVSKGRYMLACEPASNGDSGNVWAVYAPNGIRYELGFTTAVIDANSRVATYVTRISDRNGNHIEIDYGTNESFAVFIRSVQDPSDGRHVTFTYDEENTNRVRLKSISDGYRTWKYSYQGIYEYNDAVGALDDFLFYSDFDNYHLLSVTRPDGRRWEYEYFTEEKVPNTLSVYQNWRHLIKEVKYPYGNRITYQYQGVFFGETSGFFGKKNQVIKTKTVHTSAIDRISTSNKVVTYKPGKVWTYNFYPGRGYTVGKEDVLDDMTIIETPVGVEKYLHHGYINTAYGEIWKIGLLISKSILDFQDTTLYSEENTWHGQSISSEDYWNGRGANFRDSDTKAPILLHKEIYQNGAIFETTLSDHDGYGNPRLTKLGGTNVQDTIETDIRYYINTDLWIVNQTQYEHIAGVGDIAREFDDNGNLKSINQYGTVTSYTYTPEGDLKTEKNAKNQITRYSNYFRGTPQRIEYPDNTVIQREVNPRGTVRSETNGRGYHTSYEYDSMNRIKHVSVPTNSDVDIDYFSNNSRLVRVLTRDNYQEKTTFNGLLNPVQIEKLDTVTNQRITTVTEYDIYGRPTFISKPIYGTHSGPLTPADGISTNYDALGREVLVRNPDGTQRRYCYVRQDCGNGPVSIANTVEVKDERGHITSYSYHAYGSPDNNLLHVLQAPESVGTIIYYDKLGNVISIWQGENKGFGHIHVYHYDSRFFRVAEDQPEVGHIVYGRDAIGNLTSRQIKNSLTSGRTLPDSGVTTFGYDDLNRLTTIDYPSTTPDVTFDYDENGNIKSVTNQNSSRTYEYDANDNLLSEDITIEGKSYFLNYEYNSLDQLESITYPSGRSVSYDNDAFGRPVSVSGYVDKVSYYPGGQIEVMNLSNGVSTSFELTEREWIKSIQVNSAKNNDIVSLDYGYDGKGNVKSIRDNTAINSRTMTYDGVDRLITADGMWGTGVYTYDQEDNMKTRNMNGVAHKYLERSNKMLQMSGGNGHSILTPRYDVYGNQTRSIAHELTFDDASNLIEAKLGAKIITNRPPIIYKYDGDKHRVYRNNSEGTAHYVYSKGDSVLAEVNVDTDTSKENIYLGSRLVASIKGNVDPVAKIIAVGRVREKTMVTLDGTTSFDPDGHISKYRWVQRKGPSVSLDSINRGMVEFESPLVSKDETLVFELVVKDNRGDTGSTQISIVVELVDTDADGLSDLWESVFFSNLGMLESTGDYDKDGITDLDEFLSDSDPTVFNGLDTPDDIQVSADVSDLTLSWMPIDRANRYAIYWSTDKDVALGKTNRFYASSSPFIHDALPTGQYFYYVVVAERVDENGAILNRSGVSSVVNGRVGWKTWPQKILHSAVIGGYTHLALNQQGEANASWVIAGDYSHGHYRSTGRGWGKPQSTSYNQNSGWVPVVDGIQPYAVSHVTKTNVRLIDETDGIYAEYFTEENGWGKRELIHGDSANEWTIWRSRYNSKGEGLVVLWHRDDLKAPLGLVYSPKSGWSAAQSLPVNLPDVRQLRMDMFFFLNDGVGHLIYATDDGFKDLMYKPGDGWQKPVALGLLKQVIGYYYDKDLIKVSPSGHIHIAEFHPDPESADLFQVSSVHYDPAVGWSQVTPVFAKPFSIDVNGHRPPSLSIDMDNSGKAVLAIQQRATTDKFYIVKQFLPGSGWQEDIIRPLIDKCEFTDIPDNYQIHSPHAVSRKLATPRLLDVKMNDQGEWSILSQVDYYAHDWVLLASRYNPQAGWLEDEIIHCPALLYGTGARPSVSHAINRDGTTFILWAITDGDFEVMNNSKVFTNKYELLKGMPPFVNAGIDLSVTEGDPVTLDGSLSTDTDNYIKRYRWSQLDGTAVNIADSDLETATFIAPLVDSEETLVFELEVTDSLANASTDTVEIVVNQLSSTEPGVVLGADKTSPLIRGERLILTAKGQSDGAFEYQFRMIGSKDEETSQTWTVLQRFGRAATFAWDTTGYAGGKYQVQVVAREIGNEAVEVKDSLTYWINTPNPVTHVDLINNTTDIVTEGTSVPLESLARGGSGTTDYQYQVKNTALQADWITLRDFSRRESLAWDTSGYRGENIIRVRARNTGTSDLWVQDRRKVWVNSVDSVTSASLVSNLLSPQPSGTTVSIDTSVIGGKGVIEYQFSVRDTEGLDEWKVVQSWSTATSFNWNTVGLFGKFRIRVESRNAGSGDKAIVDEMSYWLNGPNPLSEVALKMDQASPVIAGTVVNLTASPVNGNGNFEYQFRIKSNNQGLYFSRSDYWSVLRDFDSNPHFQFNSTGFLGENVIEVRARNQGVLGKYATARTVLWVNGPNPITSVGLTASDTDVMWGDRITFKLSVAGGDGSYYMTKEWKLPGQDKYVGNGIFSSGRRGAPIKQFTFDVDRMRPGTYQMRVWVKSAATDKPVESASVEFNVSAKQGQRWLAGGGGKKIIKRTPFVFPSACPFRDGECLCSDYVCKVFEEMEMRPDTSLNIGGGYGSKNNRY